MDTFLEKKGNLVINTNIICTKYFHDCKNAYMSLIRWIKTGWNAILIHMKIAFFLLGQFIRFENFVCFYTKNCNTTTQRMYLSWIWISWLLHVGCYNDAAIFNSSFFSQYRFQIQFIIFLKIAFTNFDLLLLSVFLIVLNQEAPIFRPKSAKRRPKFFSSKTPQFDNFLVQKWPPL